MFRQHRGWLIISRNMETKTITINGKQVTLGYCYATEIAFQTLAEENIQTFLQAAVQAVDKKQMPDIRKSIFLILASISSYYESKGEPFPIEDKDLMYSTDPETLGLALGTVISLWAKFYKIPTGEPEPKKGTKGKN